MLVASFLVIALIATILLFAVLFLIIEIFVVFVGHWYGAPFVRSRKKKIDIMLELAVVRPGEQAYDLGSGDGSLVIEATRRGARAVGIEINPFLVWYSRWRIKRMGLKNRATIVRGDFRHYPLSSADIIFLYLWPSTIEKLKEKLSQELKPESRIVSNGFPIKGWEHIMEKDKVYLYGPVIQLRQ